MRRAALAVSCFLLGSCGRYADFTLPPIEAKPGGVHWTWQTHPGPVLPRGAPSQWDSIDTLNPSVLPFGKYLLNLYSGYDGRTWHTGMAISADGLEWRRSGKILSPDAKTWEGDYIAANGAAAYVDFRYLYWYQGGRLPRIGLATSRDGRGWTKQGDPVLEPGPRGSWDERGVADPYVIRASDTFYMYYLGQDRARRQRLGLARSSDGIRWQKYRGNPILELGEPGAFDDTGLGEPAVWQQFGSYWMLYSARDRQEYRRLGLARSQEGVKWSRVTDQPVFQGNEPWNAKVVCDATVLPDGDSARVWYGGGDRAEPAENLHGQIGYAVLRLKIGD